PRGERRLWRQPGTDAASVGAEDCPVELELAAPEVLAPERVVSEDLSSALELLSREFVGVGLVVGSRSARGSRILRRFLGRERAFAGDRAQKGERGGWSEGTHRAPPFVAACRSPAAISQGLARKTK